MPTTFNWIYLGRTGSIDPTEGNNTAENAGALVGTTWGTSGDPLYTRITSATTIDNGGISGSLDNNNSVSNDEFITNIGAGIQTFTYDANAVYNATITYTDGTTATITAVLVQSTTGELFFAPEITANPDTLAQESKPIVSITLGTLVNATNSLAADRATTGWDDGWVEGTSSGDLINSTYIEPIGNGTDRIDNNDGINGSSMNDDRVRAGAGDDTVFAGLGNDLVYGGTGLDVLYGEAGDDTLYGEDGNDRLYGGAGNDRLYGGDSSDLLYGGADQDTLYGESGSDTLYGDAGNDLVYGGGDSDLLYGGDDQDTLYGDAGNDTLFGGAGNDRLFGGVGDDLIEGGAGADILYGGSGDDTLYFGAGDDTVYGGDGNDLIDDVSGSVLSGVNLIYGGAGNDTIWTGDDADTLYGDAGDDNLFGEGGNDLIFGGDGNDLLVGGSGNDTLTGGAGTDTIYGGDDRDLILVSFNDVIGSEFVDGGSGAGISADNDTLQVDITGFGWTRIDLAYDPLNAENGTITFFAADEVTVIGTLAFTDIETLVIVCFTAGTRITTASGPVPVEELSPGDLVVTRDNGLQPLRWVGRRVLTALDLQARPELQPVRIGAGALGGEGPERSLLLSPQHRVLIAGVRAEMYFGESEVLVPAKHLVGLAEVSRSLPAEGVTYVHILFDRHEIVQSEGTWTESFQPAERTLNALEQAARAEVLALFPELAGSASAFPAARLSLRAHEARVLIAD